MLAWPACRNARDLGRLPAVDGRRTRRRALIRSDSFVRLTASGIAAVRSYGVSRIIDMRSPWEFDTAHPFATDARYQHLAFIDDRRDDERDPGQERDLSDLYRGSLERNGSCIAKIVAAVADAPPGAVALHCVAGTDRTGMLIAVLLDVLGVPRSTIAEDYERSYQPPATPPNGTQEDVPGGSNGQTILDALDHLDKHWTSPAEYLARHGVTSGQFATLRDRFVE